MASALDDLIEQVYIITGRPDLVAETKQAVLRATLKEHSSIDYPRDLVVTASIPLDNTSGLWRYSLSEVTLGLYGQLRKILTIREVLSPMPDALHNFQGYWGDIEFHERAANNIFDAYQMEQQNYYYRQGNSINLAAIRAVTAIAIQYYKRPDLGTACYDSWIAGLFPYVIYEAAAADIFKMVGKDEEAQRYAGKLMDNRLDIIKSEIGAIG